MMHLIEMGLSLHPNDALVFLEPFSPNICVGIVSDYIKSLQKLQLYP